MEELHMNKWIVFKKGMYIAGTDSAGYPIHTTKREEAWEFTNFEVAMRYLKFGYVIEKLFI